MQVSVGVRLRVASRTMMASLGIVAMGLAELPECAFLGGEATVGDCCVLWMKV